MKAKKAHPNLLIIIPHSVRCWGAMKRAWRARAENHRAVARRMKTPQARRTVFKLAEMAEQLSRKNTNISEDDAHQKDARHDNA